MFKIARNQGTYTTALQRALQQNKYIQIAILILIFLLQYLYLGCYMYDLSRTVYTNVKNTDKFLQDYNAYSIEDFAVRDDDTIEITNYDLTKETVSGYQLVMINAVSENMQDFYINKDLKMILIKAQSDYAISYMLEKNILIIAAFSLLLSICFWLVRRSEWVVFKNRVTQVVSYAATGVLLIECLLTLFIL